MTEINFACRSCRITFTGGGYDNPIFLADTVSNCPKCDRKCWDITDQYEHYGEKE